MLEEFGAFTPCGQEHVTKHAHLIETSAQVIDFTVLRQRSKRLPESSSTTSTSNYALYPAYHLRSSLPGDPDSIPYNRPTSPVWKRLPNDAQALEEELYVVGPAVVWSRGSHVLKTLKHETEQLQLACFAWFPFKQMDNKKQKVPATYSTLSAQDSMENAILRKALCIVLSNAVKFHFSDGTSYYVPLPFFVQRICALDIGLLLQYERKNDGSRFVEDPLSAGRTNFASIRHLRGDAEPVIVKEDSTGSHRFSFSSDQEIVFSSSIEAKQRWLVTFHTGERLHYVWSYEAIRQSNGIAQREIPSFKNPISLQLRWKEKGKRKAKSSVDVRSTAFIAHNVRGTELLCIMNSHRHQLKVLDTEKLMANDKDAQLFELTATSAIPICATRSGMNDILVVTDDKLMLHINAEIEPLPIPLPQHMSSPVELKDPVHHRFSLMCSDRHIWRVALDGTPRSGLVRDCLAAVNCALSEASYSMFQKRFTETLLNQPLANIRTESEWESFIYTFFSFLNIHKCSEGMDIDQTLNFPFNKCIAKCQETSCYNAEIAKNIDLLVKNLHLAYEDYRLAKLRRSLLHKLGGFLLTLCSMIGEDAWMGYYVSHGLTRIPSLTYCILYDDNVKLGDPPDIRFFLRCIFQDKDKNATLEENLGVARITPAEGIVDSTYGYNAKLVWLIYQAMNGDIADLGKGVELIVSHGYRREDIQRLIVDVAAPILSTMDQLKLEPPRGLSQEAYAFLGCYETAVGQMETRPGIIDPNAMISQLSIRQLSQGRDMHAIFLEESAESTSQSAYGSSDLLDANTEKARFGYNGVVAALRYALNSERMPDLKIPEGLELRTLAMSVGRGIFSYGTFIPDIAKPFPIEPMTLSARLTAEKTIVTLDEATLQSDYLDWPKFHNGVAAGLRLSPNCSIDGAWIYSCRPNQADPQHAGFLLALGLNGNLRQLSPARRYEYLAHPLCELEKVGFLLGEAVAYRRTKSSSVTKVLSVDIPALAAPHTMSLQHSSIIKATSLLSMGLVYLESNDRRMVEVMLQEIGRHANHDPLNSSSNYESCALAAGFALGFITLGDGEKSCSLTDLSLRGKLYHFMTGMPFVTPTVNLDVTSPAATIALGLMYLKTEDTQMAARMNILETRPYLNYVRPDFLLLRVVAKNLIMWSTIRPTEEWVSKQLPEFMRHPSQMEEDDTRVWDIEASRQAEYNIITGACLCIGLRYAGSKDMQAFRYLLSRFDAFMKLVNVTPQLLTAIDTESEIAVGFQAHITKSALRTGVDVIATSAAMVMAGTGNLELLERLKELHRKVSGTENYGNHMATHIAMGLLFAGVGGYTLNTSNEAIAGLLCALYPFYPTTTTDNKYHVQAWRHLWILALTPRNY
ncbi:Anaphase-promoting complex subunit 1 [Apophysomyces ossiformis]|uniref:Anaphase-promoting complex subunit 1 n=1 Tax=Apophysomyces ossiformis TaxID=679940 RepID=A0A8H7ETJ9_9FUNG|nr:Anaphase-promoting complex subunit 1 [Apophysomyces ossiformis]